MLTNKVTRQVDLPHEEGAWIKIRALSAVQLERAADAQTAVLAEEQRWRGDVAYLRAAEIYQPSDVAQVQEYGRGEGEVSTPTEIVTVTAAGVISRSWACTKFSGDKCQFFRVCHHEPGWESIETIGDYEIRTPHHGTEKAAMTSTIEALGLAWTDEDDEDGGGE